MFSALQEEELKVVIDAIEETTFSENTVVI